MIRRTGFDGCEMYRLLSRKGSPRDLFPDCDTHGRLVFLLLGLLLMDGNASVMLQWVLVQEVHPGITAMQSAEKNSAYLGYLS